MGTGGVAGSIFDSLNQKEQAPWKKRLAYHLEGLPATVLVTAVTFVALFLDDVRLAVLPPSADVACQVLSGIIMVRPPGRCSLIAHYTDVAGAKVTATCMCALHLYTCVCSDLRVRLQLLAKKAPIPSVHTPPHKSAVLHRWCS